MATEDELRLRRYLLGELSDEHSAVLEAEYFAEEVAFDRIWAAENDLIDSYLSDGLSPQDRERFERHYLSAPQHRSRVAIARELRRAAADHVLATSREANANGRLASLVKVIFAWPAGLKLAAAAAMLLVAIGGAWLARGRGPAPVAQSATRENPSAARPPDQVNRPEPARPLVVALTLSPAGVRGADDAASLTIQPGADLVILHLESDVGASSPGADHAVVRTVSGTEVWRGPAASEPGTRPAALARIELPANALPRGDYVVTLFGSDANGGEVERYRYFLRVR